MISISIAGVNRDANVDYKTLLITEKLYSHCNTASFDFYCSDDAIAPGNGEEIIITDDLIRIFAGRILTKIESFMPPSSYKYNVDCIDYHRDLDRKLVNETYEDMMTGDIVRHIIANYCSGLTSTNVDDGVLIDGMIVFDYVQPSECIKRLAELSQYSWYVDYSKDVHFFSQAVPNAPFKIDDDQAYYKDLIFTYDFSQLRNRVRVKGLGDVNVVKQDDDSIAYIQGIEGGDGIYENIIIDETIKTDELAEDVADADLAQYKDIYIVGEFITNEKNIKAGQLIEVDSVKRNIAQNFLIQEVSLEKITIGGAEEGVPDVSYKPAAEATIGYKPADEAVVPYKKSTEVTKKVYYVYHVTIASRLKDLIGLLLDMLHQEASILPAKDITPPAVPSGLTLYTGMGITTQASLAWLKAEWNANTELDFSHYELRMKKSTDTDYTVVSTKNISFIWYSLEPGATFDVYIRAFDTSGNASNWSSMKSKTTATDVDVPAQLAKPSIVAILAGIKVIWIAGTEDNISHYKLERQESELTDIDIGSPAKDGDTSSDVRTMIDANNPANATGEITSVAIWANENMTGVKVATFQNVGGNNFSTRDYQSIGNVTAGSKQTFSVNLNVVAGDCLGVYYSTGKIELDSNAPVTGRWHLAGDHIPCVNQTFAAQANLTISLSGTGVAWTEWSTITEVDTTMWLDLLLAYTKYYRYRISTITQTGTSGTPSDPSNGIKPNQAGTGDIEALSITADLIAANSIYTNALQAGAVTASKVASNTLLISNLSSEAVNRMFQSSDYKTNIENWVKSGAITYIDGGKIYAGSITLSGGGGAAADFDWSHLFDDGNKPADNADVTANNTAYDTNYVNGVISSIVSGWRYGATTYINGGSIYCTNLAAINALLGTVHAGTIYGTRFRVGGGTNEDIYFEDSGIRLYDASSRSIDFYKSGYATFTITLYSSSYINLVSSSDLVIVAHSIPGVFRFYTTGTFQLPALASAPTGHNGGLAFRSGEANAFRWYASYDSAWHKAFTSSEGW